MGFSISSSVKTICLVIFALVVTTTADGCFGEEQKICPFEYLHHLGDGTFDTGNAVALGRTLGLTLTAAKLPYGMSCPGYPSGRWSDGLTEVDHGVIPYPALTAYMEGNLSDAKAIMFATARSPVLDRSFFTARGIKIPPYVASISTQLNWFKNYLDTYSSSPADRLNRTANALFLFGDVEANDITYALLQGKSIQEVASYITHITQAQVNVAKELLAMGATRVLLITSAPVGCYPFVLTALASDNPDDYDEMGCLKSVNDLIQLKNNDLQQAADILVVEYPNTEILGHGDMYTVMLQLINQTVIETGSIALQACCGIGGKYNYDKTRFCGSPGVPVCSDPNKYHFWDGIHLTGGAFKRLSDTIEVGSIPLLGCRKVLSPPPSESNLYSAI